LNLKNSILENIVTWDRGGFFICFFKIDGASLKIIDSILKDIYPINECA
jgi:hypothetical protein